MVFIIHSIREEKRKRRIIACCDFQILNAPEKDHVIRAQRGETKGQRQQSEMAVTKEEEEEEGSMGMQGL
jgi:hypothetical protein